MLDKTCEGCTTPTGCKLSGRCAKSVVGLIPTPPEEQINRVAAIAVKGAMMAMSGQMVKKLSADVCFQGGCRKAAETGEGCVGYCRELQREEHAAQAEAAQAGPVVETARAAQEATVAPAPGLEALGGIVLCVDCKHFDRKITQPKLMGDCTCPKLPLNLITGDRRFPCIIARGYSALCGTNAQYWERK